MLVFCNLQDERKFYNENWRKMSDDIERYLVHKYQPVIYTPTDEEVQDKLLEQLEEIFAKNEISMYTYNLPHKTIQYRIDENKKLIEEELNYDYCKL